MLAFGGVVLIIVFALHIAWIAKLAAERGRSVLLWILVGVVAGAIGVRVGWSITVISAESDRDTVMLLGALAPLPALILPMVAVAVVLYRLSVNVALRRDWPVHSSAHGAVVS